MPKWRFEDECLAPEPYIVIEYKGPNPFKVVKQAEPILRTTLELGAPDYWPRDFKWDVTSDPRSFFTRIYCDKGIDARSTIRFEVIMKGKQPADPNKEGTLTIKIGGRLITEFPQDTPFQKSALYRGLITMYRILWYDRVRRGYLRMCEELINKVANVFRQLLKIPAEK